MVSETETPRPPYVLYDELIAVEKINQLVIVQWAIDSNGGIGGFSVRPLPVSEAASGFLDYHTQTPLRLPFAGEWLVLWGGRTLAQNRHASSPDQRFAIDFVIAQSGATHKGAGTSATDYYCFGHPILAPGPGIVVEAVDTMADNAPGTSNTGDDLGNHIIIDHGNGEYSFLAHLQRGSIRVKAGERIVAGAAVGRCGNSGNSTEPHLHYHLQSTPSFMVGAGMPAQFQHYVADGAPVTRGEPTRGQRVSPGP